MDDARDEELAELLAEVRRIDVQASRLVTSLMAGEYTSVFRGSGLEFDGVREYEEGDDPRTERSQRRITSGRPAQAEIGKPPPSALPIVTTSGNTSSASLASQVPVRPSPV